MRSKESTMVFIHNATATHFSACRSICTLQYVCLVKSRHYKNITNGKEVLCAHNDKSLKIFSFCLSCDALHSPLTGLSPPPLFNTVSYHRAARALYRSLSSLCDVLCFVIS